MIKKNSTIAKSSFEINWPLPREPFRWPLRNWECRKTAEHVSNIILKEASLKNSSRDKKKLSSAASMDDERDKFCSRGKKTWKSFNKA